MSQCDLTKRLCRGVRLFYVFLKSFFGDGFFWGFFVQEA